MVPGGFRLGSGRFRVGSGWFRLGSGRFRQFPGGFRVLHTPFIFLWETDKNLVFAVGWMYCDSKLHCLHETHVANLVPRVLSLLRERLVTCLCMATQAAQRVRGS